MEKFHGGCFLCRRKYRYLTVTFSLNDLYDQELEGSFDIVLNVEKYNPNYTDTGEYSGTSDLVKISSTTGGASGASARYAILKLV